MKSNVATKIEANKIDVSGIAFTDANIARLAPAGPSSDTVYWSMDFAPTGTRRKDFRLGGLGVRVRAMAGGIVKRTWAVQLRVGGMSRRESLGAIDALPIKQANARAEKMKDAARDGIDPKKEKQDRREADADTFGRLSPLFLREAKLRLRPRSYAEIERHIEKHLSKLEHDPVRKIDRKRVAEILSGIATPAKGKGKGKDGRKAGGPVVANRARATLSTFFSWAIGEGFIDANPVTGTTKRKEQSRDRVLPAAELAAVWASCGDDDYGRIVRLLILTGQRRDEIGGMSESELQRDRGMWTLPAERSKNGRSHDVPLSDAALALLPEPREDRGLLFGRGAGPFSGWSRCKERLDARIKEASPKAKGLAPWVLHDLRRSAATGMAEIGIQPHVIEAVLNHVSGSKAGVAGIYNRATYAEEKKDALARWGEHVAALIAGQPSNVVALPTKAGA